VSFITDFTELHVISGEVCDRTQLILQSIRCSTEVLKSWWVASLICCMEPSHKIDESELTVETD